MRDRSGRFWCTRAALSSVCLCVCFFCSKTKKGKPKDDAAEHKPDGAAAGDGGEELAALQPGGANSPTRQPLDEGEKKAKQRNHTKKKSALILRPGGATYFCLLGLLA